ncbi:MAG TPA: hypothetical protein VIR01_10070, partial [Pyrinomonadaceae bacterium]
ICRVSRTISGFAVDFDASHCPSSSGGISRNPRPALQINLIDRDVCDPMAERGVTVAHTTVLRWVQRFDTAG